MWCLAKRSVAYFAYLAHSVIHRLSQVYNFDGNRSNKRLELQVFSQNGVTSRPFSIEFISNQDFTQQEVRLF